jgi:hypothetical protein
MATMMMAMVGVVAGQGLVCMHSSDSKEMANSKCALAFEDKKVCEGISSAVNATCQTSSTQICKAARNEHNKKCIDSWKLSGAPKNGDIDTASTAHNAGDVLMQMKTEEYNSDAEAVEVACNAWQCSSQYYTDASESMATHSNPLQTTWGHNGYAKELFEAVFKNEGGNIVRKDGKITSYGSPNPHANGGYEVEISGVSENNGNYACTMTVRFGFRFCQCITDTSKCPVAVYSELKTTQVTTADQCSGWFMAADFHMRTLANGWRSGWVYDTMTNWQGTAKC